MALDDDKHSTNDSTSSDDDEECLISMLGGISLNCMNDWKEEIDSGNDSPTKNKTLLHGLVDPKMCVRTKSSTGEKSQELSYLPLIDDRKTAEENEDNYLFQNVFYCPSGSRSQDGGHPPLQICELGDRGRGLVATRIIPKGSCIFTERAAIATQLPSKTTTITENEEPRWPPIQACQHCYRSLEPLSTISTELPCEELWPVLPLEFDDNLHSTTKKKIHADKYGRVKCVKCKALFCSNHCYSKNIEEYGQCCHLTNIVQQHFRQEDLCLNEGPVALATRLFCHVTSFCRRYTIASLTQLERHFAFGLCGNAENLTALEIGSSVIDKEKNIKYTLEPLYDALSDQLELSQEEQDILSLPLLHRLACKAARNSFGIRTQSPFKSYYSGLLRKTGRDSSSHRKHMQQVAKALGKSELERGMDREIEELVSPEIACLFLLTARMNHSCNPNATVISQEFVDANIDVVANRTIQPGEEIFISYIGHGQKRTTYQRRRELFAKFMFTCECELCNSSSGEPVSG